jgi:hypothetical protein
MNRKQMFTLSLAILTLLLSPQLAAAEPASTLAPLAPLSGKWVGRGEGTNGPSVVKQVFAFAMGESHFVNKTTARFKPKNGEKTGQLQESAGFFSYDPAEKSILYREFTSDGQVNRYKLERVSKDGMTLTFQSDEGNGNQAEKQVRLIFQVTNQSNLQVIFSQSPDGKTFTPVETLQMRRVKQKKKNWARREMKNKDASVALN